MFISGSTALQFFDRSFYADSDLDIYVEHCYCKPIAVWLTSIGYEFWPRKTYQSDALDIALEETLSDSNFDMNNLPQGFFESTSMGYFGRGVSNVYNFHQISNPDRKIQLITSFYAPLEIVLNFHSSKLFTFSHLYTTKIILACVMNLITHERAYSLYPHATFEEHRSLVISTEGSKQEKARKKYCERGWTMVKTVQDEDIRNARSDFTHARRYIGDSRCWTLPILPKVDLPVKVSEDFMETNTWELKYSPVVKFEVPGQVTVFDDPNVNVKSAGRVEPVMSFTILRLENLRFSYLVVDKSVQDFLIPVLLQSSKGGRYEL